MPREHAAVGWASSGAAAEATTSAPPTARRPHSLTHKQRLEGRTLTRTESDGSNSSKQPARSRAAAEENAALREQMGALTRQNYHIAKLNASYLTAIRGLERRITELQVGRVGRTCAVLCAMRSPVLTKHHAPARAQPGHMADGLPVGCAALPLPRGPRAP